MGRARGGGREGGRERGLGAGQAGNVGERSLSSPEAWGKGHPGLHPGFLWEKPSNPTRFCFKDSRFILLSDAGPKAKGCSVRLGHVNERGHFIT